MPMVASFIYELTKIEPTTSDMVSTRAPPEVSTQRSVRRQVPRASSGSLGSGPAAAASALTGHSDVVSNSGAADHVTLFFARPAELRRTQYLADANRLEGTA